MKALSLLILIMICGLALLSVYWVLKPVMAIGLVIVCSVASYILGRHHERQHARGER